ncbi:methyltransferase domain-containing protein [Flavobacterium sp. LS1R47]|jgi:2-polyprenyl-3-methyl-5-hydroxy-6-metoxy-1,4-benzoquinol methylase|uniref:Methyltransferase domain-containing protein n=1 Tax=Flavobacterium frigoritolerans TaxID=2987686 RepID=A0A9X3CA60_9FLAO|nr:methyltransferase domain-containing protein [Flavobacterium frigoritolerans]MCV9934408.1 methyltransferase domain-containing protein [Flavobacterium frigoritolerans]
MAIKTKYRTDDPEIMDDFNLKGEVLQKALDKIAKINQLLGGNNLTLQGVEKLLNGVTKDQTITIIDVGCGNGDMLRKLADYALKHDWDFKLIGIDANAFTINYARKLSVHYPNINYRCEDIFDKSFSKIEYDIALCTLTLHHFKNNEIINLTTIFNTNARRGVVINDLHRSIISYRLFQAMCFVTRLNGMSKKDGLTSILRGFTKSELLDFSKQLNLKKYTIQWKWAFRYQWIISKI